MIDLQAYKEITLRETARIKWENRLVEGSYSLTLLEMRMLIALSAHINKNLDNFENLSCSALALGELMGISKSDLYDTVKHTAKSLMGRVVAFEWTNEANGRKQWKYVHWLETIEQYDGIVYWRFAPEMAPVLLQVKAAYVQIATKEIMAFKYQYTNRLYLLLHVWEHTTGNSWEKEISIDDLRERFGINDGTLKNYADLARFAINPAVKEINETTEYNVIATPIKFGRKYRSIRFTFSKKAEGEPREHIKTVMVQPLPQQQTTPLHKTQQQEIDEAEYRRRCGAREIPPDVQKRNRELFPFLGRTSSIETK